MKSVQKIDLGLTGYDELFMNDAERKENKLPRIYDIPLSEIDDFPDHPFKVKLDEDMDIERVRTALKMLAPEERAIIQDFFFTESPIPVKELVGKYAMPKTSIYRKRDDALKKLKKILGNA